VNLKILSGKSLLQLNARTQNLLLNQLNNPLAILVAALVIAFIIVCLWLFFYTEIGLTIKSTGDNPDMSRAQGVNVNLNKVIGLAIANGLVAVSGALLAQYQGFADINMGRGAIVIGLAAIFIGLSVSLRIKPNFVVSLIGVVGGGIVYYAVYTLVIFLGFDTDLLKMLSAVIVALFLAVPYVKKNYLVKHRSRKSVNKASAKASGGEENA
jgi:putative ABC transport system permease protein